MTDSAAAENIDPVEIGVCFKPAALVLYYEDKSGSLHRRKMPVRGLMTTGGHSSLQSVFSDLKSRHQPYLKNVQDFRIEKMLRLLQENMKGRTLGESLVKVEKEFSVDPNEDLNFVSEETLERKKTIMNELFEANKKSPDDPEFQYDVQVDFPEEQFPDSPFDDDNE